MWLYSILSILIFYYNLLNKNLLLILHDVFYDCILVYVFSYRIYILFCTKNDDKHFLLILSYS